MLQELETLMYSWGDMPYHAPVLLAWTVLKFTSKPDEGMEVGGEGGMTGGVVMRCHDETP